MRVHATTACACALVLGACRSPAADGARPWLAAARETGRWLENVALPTDSGRAWPAVPDEGTPPETSLYAGSSGVVLFFLELAAATGDVHALELARSGADELLAQLPTHVEGEAAGLYTGLAGVGFALGETWRATGDTRYRDGLARCVATLASSARAADGLPGLAWGTTNDVIAGTAGIGFFLLWAADLPESPAELDSASLRELARDAAARLVALGEPRASGLDWPMDSAFPRRMPNFAHGTAGIAAFLARAGAADAAVKGAEHLLTLAERADGLRIYHHSPDGTELFYYGWCHGPCGTARLFRELERAAPASRWAELERECARALEASGLPEQRLPGFWDNVSRCCGSAGVLEFFASLYARGGTAADLAFAQRVARDLLVRGTRDERGLRWIQAEQRTQPELLAAQTGLLQGAAGIGLALLHLDGAERARPPLVVLPDEPR